MEKNLNFIDHEYIYSLIEKSKNVTEDDINKILDKAQAKKGLTHGEVAALFEIKKPNQRKRLFEIAHMLKESIYGNRIVVFAPLYVSNYCVNNCVYCGYKICNKFERKKLTREEIQNEVKLLEKMGHKRLALEAGEDPINCDINYILDAIDAVYSTKFENGAIRRINVNIAATTLENYKKLKAAEIGTYILFQETYHKPTYESMHPHCLKGNYEYHLTAFDRAMEGGIDDVGGGVLFGLADPKFEVISLMLHNEHLEKTHGVGFHTISVPRLKQAEGMSLEQFPHLVDDDLFKNIVAIIRLAVPFTGLILSTRETPEMRREVIKYGVSQVSAGSSTDVGGYTDRALGKSAPDQFELADHRTPLEILKSLLDEDYVPSYCTACYRQGRTGDRFMELAKSGNIQNVCGPNALMTLMEYAMDYGDKELLEKVEEVIAREIIKIKRDDIKELTKNNIKRIKNGERDLYI
ncbi:iron-only hydrogenase maturation protein HydG [Cetobacterium ceti]|uniref:Iron-only hydrogenase maturation protein HydG n=1 Tax=Cetobacterium ceti TaxID=180163 RepID=A0A1T4MV58_9FUSO|nr:[FeFe] hydrogenase H-cluster radical SAM maturase HydG [Cetobacterium ceti]SJZ70853.1 iron-only hydrogenase maturation protein HydG [Cetobacterium ceti]